MTSTTAVQFADVEVGEAVGAITDTHGVNSGDNINWKFTTRAREGDDCGPPGLRQPGV